MTDDAREARAEWEREVAGKDALEKLVVELGAALGYRRYEALPEIAARVTRAVIVDPVRARLVLGPAFISIDEIMFALEGTDARGGVPHEALLAIVDLVNAFDVVGTPLRTICRAIARSWLAGIAETWSPGVRRWRVGFAALALGDLAVARRIAARPDIPPYEPGRYFERDVQAILAHMISALDVDAGKFAGLGALVSLIKRYGAAHSAGDFDEPTLLWLSRVVYYELGDRPVGNMAPPSTRPPIGTVAASTKDLMWRIADEQSAAANAPPPEPQTQPSVTVTLDHGAFCVDEPIREGVHKVFFGRRMADGAPVLISCDYYHKHDLETLRRTISYRIPGVLELAFVGRFDNLGPEEAIAAVEIVPAGEWLPRIAPRGQSIDVRSAAMLGRSAGQILATAVSHGVLLTRVRPEYMFAQRTGDSLEVTGLSARGDIVFSKTVGDANWGPVFDRTYYAPDSRAANQPFDDRSLVFALAVMMAEWATGRHPFAGDEVDELLDLPPAFAGLLSRGMRYDVVERPSLTNFLDELSPWSR